MFDVIALMNYPIRKIDYGKVYVEIGRDLRERGADVPVEDIIKSCAMNLSKLREKTSAGFFSSYKVSHDIVREIDDCIANSRSILDEIKSEGL